MKKERGRKMIVTTVKMRMALLLDSAMMASSFCSIVRSWKSCPGRVGQYNYCMYGLEIITTSNEFLRSLTS